MRLKYGTMTVLAALIFGAGIFVGHQASVTAQSSATVFELRTYTAAPGKLDALVSRFRDHTVGIFDRHGMKSVGYWIPTDEALAGNTLVYMLEHESADAAARSWGEFRDDPEWQRVAEESQRDGRLVENVKAIYLQATDFSAIR